MSGAIFIGDWWRDKKQMEKAIKMFGSNRAIADATDINEWTVRKWRDRHGLPKFTEARNGSTPKTPVSVKKADDVDREWLLKVLNKHKVRFWNSS